MTTKGERTVKDYENLTDREHALQRAGMYMGQLSPQELQRMIFNPDTGRYELRTLTLSEGLETIFDELLVNAVDQQNKDPRMNEIRVNIYRDHMVIRNNGAGLPLDEKKDVKSTGESVWLPTMLFGRFRSSENFNSDRQGAGLNGIGAKIANCYCREFTVETQHTKSRKFFSQTWRNNMDEEGKPVRRGITSEDEKGGYVKITMWPDFGKFEMRQLDDDMMLLLRSRVYDAAGFLRNGISVYLNDELVPVRSFAEYSDLFFGPDQPRATFCIKDANVKGMVRLELAIAHSNEGFRCHGLVNGLRTPDGTHVKTIVNDRLGKAIVENLARRREYKDLKFQPAQFKDQIFLLVKMTVDNPEFNSQRKTEFVSKPSTWGFELDFTQAFIKRLESTELGIVDAMVALKSFKENRALAQIGKSSTSKKGRIMDIPKLHDAKNMGKAGRTRTLILTEGDSAKGLALEGIVALENNDDYGIYPLRGKSLNVRDMKREDILRSETITTLMRIIGLEWGKRYDSVTQLRYQRILIWTDADVDGAHITGLLLNLIEYGWRSILEAEPDFCMMMISPIVKVTSGSGKKSELTYFFTLQALHAWQGSLNSEQLRKYDIKYLKGLGSSEPQDAKYYFRNIDRFAIPLRYTGAESSEMADMVFNSKRADDRKEWINTRYDPDLALPLGDNMECIPWPDFFNCTFIHFSVFDTVRSLPSVMDGLKPSQRKILFTMLLLNIDKDRRVASLIGSIMEKAAYHSGEQSIAEAIVGMAQRYIGTNNINLLFPSGLFGTRDDPRTGIHSNHASPRYIFSRLEPITRSIFLPSDDQLLKYLEDDGQKIEPRHYMPILPMLLVNGASGIGTGWSSDTPRFDPMVIAAAVRERVRHWDRFVSHFQEQELAGPAQPIALDEPWPATMTPWYDGFTGSTVRVEPYAFELRGRFVRTADTIHVTELPPEVYTDSWVTSIQKQYLIGGAVEVEKKNKGGKKAAAKPKGKAKSAAAESGEAAASTAKNSKEFIKEWVKELKGTQNVSIVFKCDPVKLARYSDEQLEKMLKLTSKVSFGNVWAFDVNSKLRKFASPEELIDYFCYHRYPLYEKRKALLVAQLRYDSVELRNKRRYLEMVMGYGGQRPYNVGGKSVEQVSRELEEMGFDKLKLRPKFRDAEEQDDTAGEASYWYLGKLLQWSTTEDKINKLRRECEEALDRLATLEGTSPLELWLADLDAFEQAYAAFVERKRSALNDSVVANEGVPGASKAKKRAAKAKVGEPQEPKKRAAGGKDSAAKRQKISVSSQGKGKQ